ncbi:uncharacterized protein [Cherax quadricarinatus]|nr:uncharacterized protein LOC128689466 isoform X2 [Cherax quadricarinatus]
MTERVHLQSLESFSRIQTARLTLKAITNILLQEKLEDTSNEDQDKKYKRKRSYSCDQEEGELHYNKKVKVIEALHQFMTSKRKLGDQENDEATHSDKRRKLDECFEIYDKNKPENLVNKCPSDKSKDDIGVSYCITSNMFNDLKKYFVNLSPKMWTNYGKVLISETLKKIMLENIDKMHLKKVIEYIFCEKLTAFSTMTIENFSTDFEEVIYSRLKHCRKLLFLEITVIPREARDIISATLSLQRLKNLQCLWLLPSTRYSFHWALEVVAQQCSKLCELKVVYSSDLFDAGKGVACLQNCRSLTALWLFNFGRKSETLYVSELLRSLPDLKILFHKELPNAILELRSEKVTFTHDQPELYSGESSATEGQPQAVSCQLCMERVDLCWYQRAVGYQLVYVPSSYLMGMAQVCPKLKLLNLVGPPCLAQVIASLPCLQTLVLHQASLASCLKCSLRDVTLNKISDLRVSDVWDLTHDMISAIACGCPNLEVLSITCSRLEAVGTLQPPPHRSAFPCLREVTLVPTTLYDLPALTSPTVWQLGAALTAYILTGASSLTSIHLQYKAVDIPHYDVPSEQHLEAALCCPRPALRHIKLEWPPAASLQFVGDVLAACPALSTLGSITTWPLTTHQCATLVARYGSLLHIT